jgi:hypothetical protein
MGGSARGDRAHPDPHTASNQHLFPVASPFCRIGSPTADPTLVHSHDFRGRWKVMCEGF